MSDDNETPPTHVTVPEPPALPARCLLSRQAVFDIGGPYIEEFVCVEVSPTKRNIKVKGPNGDYWVTAHRFVEWL